MLSENLRLLLATFDVDVVRNCSTRVNCPVNETVWWDRVWCWWCFSTLPGRREELSIQDECILRRNWAVVPELACQRILGHPGISQMRGIAQGVVRWPGLATDIENQVKSCQQCQAKQKAPASAPLHPWEWHAQPQTHFQVDYAGSFMGKMFLVVVDAHSKWLKEEMVPSVASSNTIAKLRTTFATHGLLNLVVSDNGTAFTSAAFRAFLSANGIHHMTSSPYHPTSSGLAVRYVQTFKNVMKKSGTNDLQQQLSRFLFHYCNTPHSATGLSSAQLYIDGKMIKDSYQFHVTQSICLNWKVPVSTEARQWPF